MGVIWSGAKPVTAASGWNSSKCSRWEVRRGTKSKWVRTTELQGICKLTKVNKGTHTQNCCMHCLLQRRVSQGFCSTVVLSMSDDWYGDWQCRHRGVPVASTACHTHTHIIIIINKSRSLMLQRIPVCIKKPDTIACSHETDSRKQRYS